MWFVFYSWPWLKCSDYDVLRKRYLLYLKSVRADLCEMCCAHGGRDLLWSRQEWACLVGGFNFSLQWHLLICLVIPWFFICITTSVEGLGIAVLSECLESCNFQRQTFYIDRYINLVIASCTTSKTTAATRSSTSGSVKCVLSFPNKCNHVISLGQLRDFSHLVCPFFRTFSCRWSQLPIFWWSLLLKMEIRCFGPCLSEFPLRGIVTPWLRWCLAYLSPCLNWFFRVVLCYLYSNNLFLLFFGGRGVWGGWLLIERQTDHGSNVYSLGVTQLTAVNLTELVTPFQV